MGLNLANLGQAISALKGISGAVGGAVDDALEQVAFEILKEAKVRVPVDTGFLRSSGSIEVRAHSVVITFGADYAAAVHERTDRTYQNGEAKYLEKAVNVVLSKNRAADIIADRLTEALL